MGAMPCEASCCTDAGADVPEPDWPDVPAGGVEAVVRGAAVAPASVAEAALTGALMPAAAGLGPDDEDPGVAAPHPHSAKLRSIATK